MKKKKRWKSKKDKSIKLL